jgi:hypothetical protein
MIGLNKVGTRPATAYLRSLPYQVQTPLIRQKGRGNEKTKVVVVLMSWLVLVVSNATAMKMEEVDPIVLQSTRGVATRESRSL